MDIKWKNYSHSTLTKIIIFIIAVLCFTEMTRAVVEVEVVNDGEFSRISEESYLESRSFVWESENLIEDLKMPIEQSQMLARQVHQELLDQLNNYYPHVYPAGQAAEPETPYNAHKNERMLSLSLCQ